MAQSVNAPTTNQSGPGFVSGSDQSILSVHKILNHLQKVFSNICWPRTIILTYFYFPAQLSSDQSLRAELNEVSGYARFTEDSYVGDVGKITAGLGNRCGQLDVDDRADDGGQATEEPDN